jgi:hypothetical protein
MDTEYNHLHHATWECKYHVVFTPNTVSILGSRIFCHDRRS